MNRESLATQATGIMKVLIRLPTTEKENNTRKNYPMLKFNKKFCFKIKS